MLNIVDMEEYRWHSCEIKIKCQLPDLTEFGKGTTKTQTHHDSNESIVKLRALLSPSQDQDHIVSQPGSLVTQSS